VVIIVALSILRFIKGAGDPPYGVDASYYFQLARHVANGDGLVTTVSLYHEGWILPAKTPIYPLWPLVMGYAGRVIGLANAADLLPRVLYVIDLVLLYLLAHAVAVRFGAWRMSAQWWIPGPAHWIVLIFGLAPRYFGATTHPYTEGLAFAMAFASFLALERFDRTRSAIAAAASGLFAGLAFLARTQMVGVAIGCFAALAWFAWRDRSARRGAILWSAVALATVTPWFLFLGFVPGVMNISIERADIPMLEGWTRHATALEWLAARLQSFAVMFDPSNAYSYVQSFGVVAYLVPLAAIVAIAEMIRRKRFAAPQSLFPTAILVAGLFFFFNLMLYHSDVWMPWLFGWRHGLPYIFLIMLAVPYLVARGGRYAVVIAFVLVASTLMSALAVAAFVRSDDVRLTDGEAQLVRWLPPAKMVISTNPQILASISEARFHWIHCDASGETTTAMLRAFPIDYVLMYEHETRCRFVNEAGPMRLIAAFGEPGRRVFVLQPLTRRFAPPSPRKRGEGRSEGWPVSPLAGRRPSALRTAAGNEGAVRSAGCQAGGAPNELQGRRWPKAG
jgi:hypothetical protein